MNARLMAALVAGKLTQKALRRLAVGGGTAAPGLVASAIDPDILFTLTSSLPYGSIIITGTNGKTTTARLVSTMLQRVGLSPLHNRSGSNMMRGLVSAAVAAADRTGRIRGDVGVWEVDEATLPDAIQAVQPSIVVVNNLFRDQLDRYGEVNTVAAIWEHALTLLPIQSTVILNADDPRVAHLGHRLKNRVVYFGIEDDSCALPALPEAADSIHCLVCAQPLLYDAVFSSHMGRYRCTHCGLQRPAIQVKAIRVAPTEANGTDITIEVYGTSLNVYLPLPGLYNVYNALAATAVGMTLGLKPEVITDAISDFRAAFGRVERLKAGDREIALFLVKNPAGFNEVLRTIFTGDTGRHVLIVINDLLADGTDVSWLWDVDFETMGDVATAIVSGIRAHDMALRLKYAQIKPRTGAVRVEPDISRAIDVALELTPSGETLYILPTYTAMLAVKNDLAQRGLAPRWQDD